MFMKAVLGWVVAVIVALVAAVILWWPKISGEAMPQQQETLQTATSTAAGSSDPVLAGTWKSNTDAKFTREFRTDGVVIDRYEGEASAGINGSWEVVDPSKEAVLAARASALAGMTVIKMVWENGVEVTYMAINKLDGKSMTTTDLTGAGSVTTYIKL
jgi:hypothetical protein